MCTKFASRAKVQCFSGMDCSRLSFPLSVIEHSSVFIEQSRCLMEMEIMFKTKLLQTVLCIQSVKCEESTVAASCRTRDCGVSEMQV